MKFYQVMQGSAEWYGLRIGRPTASNFHRIVTPKGEISKQATRYLYRLVAERLLHDSMDDELGYVKWVEWGRINEVNAVAQFEFVNELRLQPGGFCVSDDGRLGASPDRIIMSRPASYEAVEIKCPAPQTMIEYHLEGLGDDYRPQVQGQLLVGEFRAVHFYAWHPQMPAFHKITLPDANYQSILARALDAFCVALDTATERARSIGAYAVVRRTDTPADAAYGPGPADLMIVDPEARNGSV
jgi:hypothetical protein